MLNKKGLSPIIATVLIILLTISAGAVIVQFIVPFVKTNLYGSTRCTNYQNYFTFDDSLGFNCNNADNSFVTIRARTVDKTTNYSTSDLNDSITGIILVFKKGEKTKTAQIVGENITAMPSSAAVKLPNPGDIRTYNVTLDDNYDSVDMHVVLSSGTCDDISDSIKTLRSAC